MKRDEIISLIQAHSQALERFGVQSLDLFGSWARDEARPDSDVDLLVEFRSTPDFDQFMDLKFFLEDLLHRRVDLVTASALKPRMRPQVEREAVHVT